MKAMIVDDSSTMRRIQRNLMEKLGFADVAEAKDGQDGYEQMQAGADPDVVLLDVNMPKMDGFGFLKAVRAIDQFKDTKIVMCTSESEKSKILQALKAGANSYVVKPFTPETLAAKLKDLKII